MSRFAKFNKGTKTVKEGIDTKNLEFKPLKDFIGQELICVGFFFTYGKYGQQVVAVCEDSKGKFWNVNMPKRAVEQFECIKADSEAVEELTTTGAVMGDIKEVDSKNGKTTGYEFL